MPLSESTYQIFSQLARYCRTGEMPEIEGTRKDRLSEYHRLVNNIVRGNLENAYPITYAALSEEEWDTLLSDFFAEWDCPSPELWRMPYALCEFVSETDYGQKLERLYLEDLLSFEWIEIEAFMMPDAQYPTLREEGDLETDTIQINLEHIIVALEYPVHRHAVTEVEKHKGQYFVICFRHPKTLGAAFLEVSAPFALLIQKLVEQPCNLREAIANTFEGHTAEQIEELVPPSKEFLQMLQAQGMIAGFP